MKIKIVGYLRISRLEIIESILKTTQGYSMSENEKINDSYLTTKDIYNIGDWMKFPISNATLDNTKFVAVQVSGNNGSFDEHRIGLSDSLIKKLEEQQIKDMGALYLGFESDKINDLTIGEKTEIFSFLCCTSNILK